MRLNKYLADAGIASRRKADELIAAGNVRVNGAVATVGQQVEESDEIVVDRETIEKQQKELVYIILNKPTGYVTSNKATQTEPKIVMQLLTPQHQHASECAGNTGKKHTLPPTPSQREGELPRVFPVGRLDKDTSGLLILTNDGLLANELTNPAIGCEKEYEVSLSAPLTEERIRKVETGMRLDYRDTRPTQVTQLGVRKARIILREGRNRQVRRVFGKVGCEVTKLKRIRVRGLWLPEDLDLGQWRQLTSEELQLLKK